MTRDGGDDRRSAYFEDIIDDAGMPTGNKRIVFRCSQFGKCATDLILFLRGEHTGLQPGPQMEAWVEEGNVLEPVVLERLVKLGWTLEGRGQEETELVVGHNILIRLHPDEIGSHPEHGRRVIEVKSASKDRFRLARRKGVSALFPEYSVQMSVMMRRYGLPGMWVVVEKVRDEETNEVTAGELHFEWVDTMPVAFTYLVKRANMIAKAARNRELPDCENLRQYPCPFHYMRPEEEREDPEAEVDVELDLLAASYDNHREAETRAKAGKEKARKGMIERLDGADERNTAEWTVSYKAPEGSLKLDEDLLKDELAKVLGREKAGQLILRASRLTEPSARINVAKRKT